MKIKKLLSMGAIGLAFACSTSIAAFADTSNAGVSAKTKALIKVVAENQYQDGKNQTDLFKGINKDSKLSSVSTEVGIVEKLLPTQTTTTSAISIAEAKYDANKDKATFEDALKKVNADNFDQFKDEFKLVATKIGDLEKEEGTSRETSEKLFIGTVFGYNNNLKVSFGKDAAGITSATLTEKGSLLAQVNEDDLQKAINEVNDLTYDRFNNYIKSDLGVQKDN